ncbi:uncharacterized protein (DUF58 family) [Catenibacillus scindens]|uniref:Uncharacterized protein (DUF58 family) n=1 Tax=Catenibacillus scindens TaxID=673271 RepID=A0A7W8HCG6_9FIRM|nr:DUF58 domain-containing protein [Catenibacillus scindens]MBB5265137.1 uncharacterized protein (DUF58 family) [Catenibacillus scindens]
MKNLPVYLLGMILCLYVLIMYTEPMFFIVFLGMVLILLWEFFTALYLRHCVTLLADMPDKLVHNGDIIPVTVHIHNKGFLPISHLWIKVNYKNKMGGTVQKQWICTYADARTKACVTIRLSSDCCGVLWIEVERFRVSGYLRVFGFSKKCGQTLDILVFPRLFSMNFEISAKIRDFIGDSDTFSKEKSGDDPSEVFDIRPFRQGDRMQRIHWKLTARTDDMMVKEFSRPIGYPVVVFFNFSLIQSDDKEHDKKVNHSAGLLDRMTKVIETGLSVSLALARARCWHYIAWCKKDMTLERHAIESEEDVYAYMGRLMYVHSHVPVHNAEAFYTRVWGAESFCTFLSVNTDLTMEKDGEIYEERGLDRDTLSGKNFIL